MHTRPEKPLILYYNGSGRVGGDKAWALHGTFVIDKHTGLQDFSNIDKNADDKGYLTGLMLVQVLDTAAAKESKAVTNKAAPMRKAGVRSKAGGARKARPVATRGTKRERQDFTDASLGSLYPLSLPGSAPPSMGGLPGMSMGLHAMSAPHSMPYINPVTVATQGGGSTSMPLGAIMTPSILSSAGSSFYPDRSMGQADTAAAAAQLTALNSDRKLGMGSMNVPGMGSMGMLHTGRVGGGGVPSSFSAGPAVGTGMPPPPPPAMPLGPVGMSRGPSGIHQPSDGDGPAASVGLTTSASSEALHAQMAREFPMLPAGTSSAGTGAGDDMDDSMDAGELPPMPSSSELQPQPATSVGGLPAGGLPGPAAGRGPPSARALSSPPKRRRQDLLTGTTPARGADGAGLSAPEILLPMSVGGVHAGSRAGLSLAPPGVSGGLHGPGGITPAGSVEGAAAALTSLQAIRVADLQPSTSPSSAPGVLDSPPSKLRRGMHGNSADLQDAIGLHMDSMPPPTASGIPGGVLPPHPSHSGTDLVTGQGDGGDLTSGEGEGEWSVPSVSSISGGVSSTAATAAASTTSDVFVAAAMVPGLALPAQVGAPPFLLGSGLPGKPQDDHKEGKDEAPLPLSVGLAALMVAAGLPSALPALHPTRTSSNPPTPTAESAAGCVRSPPQLGSPQVDCEEEGTPVSLPGDADEGDSALVVRGGSDEEG